MNLCYLMAMHQFHVQKCLIEPYKLDLAYLFSVLYIESSAYNFLSHLSISNCKDLEIPASTLTSQRNHLPGQKIALTVVSS